MTTLNVNRAPPAVVNKDAVDKMSEAVNIEKTKVEDELLQKFFNFIQSHHPDIKLNKAYIDISDEAITKEEPLIVPCRHTDRIGANFDNAYKRRNIRIKTPTMCIIFHHTEPNQTTQRIYGYSTRAEHVVNMIDALYDIKTSEIYECEYNQKAARDFVDHFKSISIS
ncbi:hypothetical protein [Kistimonas asteriae]|uniref:hypothetical protein n=1 Tax=Kistimonas asteriae TaxID=517724 RepID=UPI001BA747FD|nr:hypothetical protein [Kistimonas asteriae]